MFEYYSRYDDQYFEDESRNSGNTPSPSDSIDAEKNSVQDAASNHDATETDAKKLAVEKLDAEELNVAELRKTYRMLNYSIDNLYEILIKSIIGQNECVKKLLFVAYNNHFLNMLEDSTGINVKRLNALAIGPSGVGKTMTISMISKLLGVPFVKLDATSLTSAGYIGSDVDSIYLMLLKAAGGDIKAAQRGIIFIDEIDKKVSSNPSNTADRDINGTAVQEELLKLLQPSIAYIGKDLQPFDPHGVTIFLGGRFKELEKIREKRLNGKSVIGFKNSVVDSDDDFSVTSTLASKEYIPEDLIEAGFLDEFVGRLLVYAEFKRLSLFDLITMTHSDNSILQQYLEVFKARGVDLYIDDINFFDIACEILQSPTGARNLEKKIIDLIYPALYQTLQNYGPGICEINENKEFFGIFEPRKK